MKSFKAKLYIEDNLATIEFDVTMKGEYDEDYTPGWDFGMICHEPEKKELSQTLVLSIYNQDDMKMVGEIFQTDNHGDLRMLITSSSMDPKAVEATEEELIQEENLAKEISLQFLDLWLKGKECHKYNFIYKDIADGKPPISPHKYIRRGNYWHVYVKKFGEKEFTYVVEDNRAIQEGIYSEESMVEMKDVYEQIKHNKLSPTYPDGTPARTVQTERDENGNLQPKEN